MTVKEAKSGAKKLNEFLQKNSFVKMDGANVTIQDIESIPQIFSDRKKNQKKALALFQKIGKQICLDCGVKWGSVQTETLADDLVISQEAERKFKIFLKFLENH